MTSLIMGTAGHIDHGKTSLVKALTGIDLDRLEEEKRRGITIELGFASLDLGGGARVGVVDVPGHEKFVKTMVAGAQGVDFVMLVVAADEGVMPQTSEHLAICDLLGVKKGLVALTKSDKADDETRAIAIEDVKELIAGTFLEGAPIAPCSSTTGEGIDELKNIIRSIAASLGEKSRGGIFRMPVDRSFTVKGHGTVVTGTVIAGGINKGEEVEILPTGRRAVVRELEAHGEKVETGWAGYRLALNLAGIEKDVAQKGTWLARPGEIIPTRAADAWTTVLVGAAGGIAHGSEVLVHAGTAHVLAEADVLSGRDVEPGAAVPVRFHFETPLALITGDRFVIRSFARRETVGGGVVLDPAPGLRTIHRGRKGKRESVAFLGELNDANDERKLRMIVESAGVKGIERSTLRTRLPIEPSATDTLIAKLSGKGVIPFGAKGERFVSRSVFDNMAAELVAVVDKHHRDNPMSPGPARGAMKTGKFKRAADGLFEAVVDSLKTDKIDIAGDIVKLKGFVPRAADADNKDLAAIEKLLLDAGNTPPSPDVIAELLKRDRKEALKLLKFLVDEGKARKVSEELYYHKTALDRIEADLVKHIREHGGVGPVEFKELTGASRKFAIALLEYFDREKITMRVGDKRVLRS